MGRPTSLTPERHQAIVNAVKRGLSPERAAEATGVHARTYYGWMQRGQDDLEGNHPDPGDYTLKQLRALAADQDIELPTRITKKDAATLITVPTIYSQFFRDVKTADALGEDYAIAQLHRTIQDSWQGWMTLLERRWPQRWARVSTNPEQRQQETPTPVSSAQEALEAGKARLKVVEGGAG
jgi:transposase